MRILKRDAFGRVELVSLSTGTDGEKLAIRRVACGGRIPGSALVARVLLAREARALRVLAADPPQAGVPRHPSASFLFVFLERTL